MIGLSCHSRNYGPGTPDEIFSFIHKLGFTYIDVDAVGTIRQSDVLENPVQAAAATSGLAEKYQLKLSEYFMGNVLVEGMAFSPTSGEIRLRDSMYLNFDKVCRFAQQSGFASIMGSIGSVNEELGVDRSFAYSVEVLGKMVQIAADRGVAFHVEPSRNSLANSPENAMNLVKAVDGLKYTLDFLHFQINGFPQEETMRLLPFAGHMHARQAAVNWPKCPYEHGEIDYDRIMKSLRGMQWSGVIAMEYWNGPAEEAAGINPVEQTILMRYELKKLIRKYNFS